MANIFVAATATWNGKALKKAKKEINVFEKQIKKLGATIGVSLSAAALINYSKKAVQAFAADQKAAKALEQQLKNTGYQFSAPGVEMYIANLQKTTGVLDDELRPAFQQLLTVTGSITKSQDALSTALNVSAATGKSLSEVSAALTRGFSGNTQSLSKLGAGISKTTLKAGDMDAILGELNKKFAGQAQARLTTYAGKMDLLKVASENVKEEIGKGILGALDALSKDTSIEDTTTKMENFGKSIGDAITGTGLLIAELKKIPGAKKGADIVFGTNIFSLLGKLVEEDQKSKAGTKPNLEPRFASRVYLQQLRLENKLFKQKQLELALLDAKNKKQTEIDKLKDKFDVERIGLMAALNAATDEETKLRIRAQLAILDNNEALAKKYNAELNAKLAADNLADAANKAASALTNSATKYDEIFNNLLAYNKSLGIEAGAAAGLAASSARLQAQADAFFASQAARSGSTQYPSQVSATTSVQTVAPTTVNVNVEGSVLTEQDLTNTINETILRINKMGRGTTPAGGLSGGT